MIEKRGEGPLRPDWGDKPYRSPVPKSFVTSPAVTTDGTWHCLGVLAGSLKLHGSEHDLPANATPEQPTTAENGMWVYGLCETCEKRTVWKKRLR